jgi:hypothetical protein
VQRITGADEQPHSRLPGEVLRVPVAGVAARHALALEEIHERSLVRCERRRAAGPPVRDAAMLTAPTTAYPERDGHLRSA